MTSNETCLAAEISGPIIYEGISFNLSQKPRLEKVLYLSRNLSKGCQPPKRRLISRDLLGVIHDQNNRVACH